MKYSVMIAVDVPHYAEVDVEADSKEDALDMVEKKLEIYYCEIMSAGWDANWSSSENLRVVDAVESR